MNHSSLEILSMRPTFINSDIAILPVSAMDNTHPPSTSQTKYARAKSNHGKSLPPIQVESDECSLPKARKCTNTDLSIQYSKPSQSQKKFDNFSGLSGLDLLIRAASENDKQSTAQENKCTDSGSDATLCYFDTDKAEEPKIESPIPSFAVLKREKRLKQNSEKSNPETPESYVCRFIINTAMKQNCGKKFSNKPDFVKHMAIHSGSKFIVCSICSERFAYNSSLLVHMRIHTKDKPYLCNICGKGLTQKGSLTRHIRAHTGNEFYSCEICGNTYTTKASLKRHKVVHSRGETNLVNQSNPNKLKLINIRKKPISAKSAAKGLHDISP